MFTIDQIISAHAKVKSGADFPGFIQDLRKLGVTFYETFVSDGHTSYFGKDGYEVLIAPGYIHLTIANIVNKNQFWNDLKVHQLGKSTFLTFCRDAAKSGVEKWTVRIGNMTCTYYDRAGNEMLVETIQLP